MTSSKSGRRGRPAKLSPDPSEVSVPVHTDELEAQPRWSKALSITIDGPAGSGKSTIARLVAETIGFQYIDTGATYRALGWLALERGIPLESDARLRGLAIAQPVMLDWAHDRWSVSIAGHDVTDAIREPRIDDAASRTARHDAVRDVLVARQRQYSLARDSVLDGRDCGTRVRPDADLKIRIAADPAVRAARRAEQQGLDVAEVERQIRERDERDARQSGAADDAVTIDNSDRPLDEVVAEIVDLWLTTRRELFDGEITSGRTAREWIEGEHGPDFDTVIKRTRPIWEKGFRLQTVGEARVPDGPCVFIANHSSMWDPAFLITPLNRRIRYMGKFDLTSMPVVKDLGDSIGFFPVRRGSGDRVALHIGEEVLRSGESLGVFPEGTRVYEGRLARPKQGAARLALITGVPIVPVAIYGNRWTESLFKVTVAFGRPHSFDGWRATPGNVARATTEVWADVQELWDALKADRLF